MAAQIKTTDDLDTYRGTAHTVIGSSSGLNARHRAEWDGRQSEARTQPGRHRR